MAQPTGQRRRTRKVTPLRLFTLLLLLSLGAVSPGSATELAGRIVADGEPQAGFIVSLWQGIDRTGTPLATAGPTTADGRYRFDLPDGEYSLIAEHSDGRVALTGRIPIELEEEPIWIGLQVVDAPMITTSPYDDPEGCGIEGIIREGGKPVEGAYVSLYYDDEESLKGRGYRISLPTGPDGTFFFDDLPEGRYHLVARKRQSGRKVGPVVEGDLLAYPPRSPVSVTAGKLLRVELAAIRKSDEPAVPLTSLTLQGVILDEAGKPVGGLHVFAYRNRVIGHQQPDALSAVTGPDGRFRLPLPAAGRYYVGARQEYGDSPTPGELFGLYDESSDHGIDIKGDATPPEIHIRVAPIRL